MRCPALDAAARQRVIRGVWDNLGRTVAEMPHIPALNPTEEGPGWVLEGVEVQRACHDAGGPVIIFSGHIGSWEMLPPADAARPACRWPISTARPATPKSMR